MFKYVPVKDQYLKKRSQWDQSGQVTETNRADIDYLSMMSGISLDTQPMSSDTDPNTQGDSGFESPSIGDKHSPKFSIVEEYYKRGLWDEIRVKNAVAKQWITKEEYKQITGNDYKNS